MHHRKEVPGISSSHFICCALFDTYLSLCVHTSFGLGSTLNPSRSPLKTLNYICKDIFFLTRSLSHTLVERTFWDQSLNSLPRASPLRRCMCVGKELGGKQINVFIIGGHSLSNKMGSDETPVSVWVHARLPDSPGELGDE